MGKLDVSQYKKLKAAGKVIIKPYGNGEALLEQQLFDIFTGEPQNVPAIINIAQIKQQQEQFNKEVATIVERKANFDELIADIEKAQGGA